MPAPTNSPVITAIPLNVIQYLLGEVTNLYQPVKMDSWSVVIPNPLLGNEAQAAFAAFTTDGVTVNKGVSGLSIKNLVGVFANYSYWEGDPGSNPYTETLGGEFLAPVLSTGSIYAYNSTAIATTISSGLKVVLTVSYPTTPAAILVGSFIQGSDPSGSTTLDVSAVCRVRSAQATVGAGFLLDILQPS